MPRLTTRSHPPSRQLTARRSHGAAGLPAGVAGGPGSRSRTRGAPHRGLRQWPLVRETDQADLRRGRRGTAPAKAFRGRDQRGARTTRSIRVSPARSVGRASDAPGRADRRSSRSGRAMSAARRAPRRYDALAKPKQGLLRCILGVLDRSEHAIAVDPDFAPVALDKVFERGCIEQQRRAFHRGQRALALDRPGPGSRPAGDEAAHLRPGPALGHAAPAPAAVLRLVQEQVAATAAGLHARERAPRQQGRGGVDDRPAEPVELPAPRPCPREAVASGPDNACPRASASSSRRRANASAGGGTFAAIDVKIVKIRSAGPPLVRTPRPRRADVGVHSEGDRQRLAGRPRRHDAPTPRGPGSRLGTRRRVRRRAGRTECW